MQSALDWSTGRLREATCPLCGSRGRHLVVVSTRDPRTDASVEFARCSTCRSVWPIEVEPLRYPTDDSLFVDPEYRQCIHHALELVSGLDRQVALVESLGAPRGGAVLEVGANVGVLSSYLAVMWDATVECVEPSVFGEMAREAFGLSVHRGLFGPDLVTDRDRYDVIVSIEVLEHVDDPMAFLREIRRRLAPDGVALITTPAAESLTPSLDEAVALGVLSVGGHQFLYTADRLEHDLRAAGFDAVEVERGEHELIARVGRDRFDRPDAATVSECVHRYRDARTPPPGPVDPRTELGLEIDRYLTHRAADPSAGADAERAVEAGLAAVFGISMSELRPAIERVLASRDLPSFGAAAPFRFGEFLYWRGQRGDLSELQRTSLWEASVVTTTHGLQVDPQNLGPLANALGPAVLALAGRLPGEFAAEMTSARRRLPDDLAARLTSATTADRARRAGRRLLRAVRR